jgi:TP901 family phage tail tape measure protein
VPRPTISTTFNAVDRMSGPMRRMQGSVTGFSRSAQRSLQQVGRIGMRGLQIATAALGVATGYVAREFIQFDSAITNASAKFSDLNLNTAEGQERLAALGRIAREVGATTKFSATEAAAGLDFLAMAGFNSEQAMVALPGVTALAIVAQTDLATATDIASDALGAFGLMTEDTAQLQENFTRINDVMAQTMTSANTNMEQLFESITAGAPTFTAAGQSLESFNALVGIMANSGVKGAQAGTQLRNVMLRLADPTAEAADILKTLGVQTQDESGNFRDIVDILADFESGLEGMGTAQRSAALSTIFGARSVTGINLLLQEGSESIAEFREGLEGATGASQRMADIIGQSLGNKLLGLKSAAIEIGFKFIEGFRDKAAAAIDRVTEALRNMDVAAIIEKISEVVDRFVKLWESGLIPAILAGVAAYKAMSIAIGLYQAAIAAAKAVQLAFNVAVSANVIGLVVIAIAALVAGIVLLIKNWDKVTEWIGVVWDKMKAFGNWVAEKFLAFFVPIGEFFAGLFAGIVGVVQNIVGWIQNAVQGIGDAIGWVVDLFDREARQERRQTRREARQDRRGEAVYGDSANSGIGQAAQQFVSETTNNAAIDVNFGNVPQNVRIGARGLAPNMNMNVGYRMAGL